MKNTSKQQLIEVFLKCSTSNISDAMSRKGAMIGIEARQPNIRIAGQAVTVLTANGDWAKPLEAVEKANTGDIIVIDQGGEPIAMWGELLSTVCQKKGIKGVIIDGAVRDIDDIHNIGFPVWSRHITPNAGDPKGYGKIGFDIQCGGQTVSHGDWIVADEMGVVVIPQRKAQEVALKSIGIYEKENKLRKEIKKGKILSSLLGLK